MLILSLDPSSTCTGYAILQDRPLALIEYGRMKGKREARYFDRIRAMQADLETIFEEFPGIGLVVIEAPDGKIHRYNRASGGAGQSVYGVAVGAVWALSCLHCPKVVEISVNQWTRGQSKETRLLKVKAQFPDFDDRRDKGRDASDATAMALWYLDHQIAFRGRLAKQALAAGGRR